MKNFTLKEDEVGQVSPHQVSPTGSPVINILGEAFSNYDRGTYEFEVQTEDAYPQEEEIQQIQDLNFGVNLAILRPELAKQFLETKAFFDTYFDISKTGWKGPDKVGCMKYYWRKDPNYFVFHTELDIDAPLEAVAAYLVDESFGFKYDKNREYNVELRRESAQCKLFHYGVSGTWPISGRDMLVYRFEFFEDPDTFRLHSMPVKDLIHPPPKGTVRADLFVQGAKLSRLEGNKTRYWNSTMFNPKVTGAPMFLLRGAIKDASDISIHFKAEVEKAWSQQSSY